MTFSEFIVKLVATYPGEAFGLALLCAVALFGAVSGRGDGGFSFDGDGGGDGGGGD